MGPASIAWSMAREHGPDGDGLANANAAGDGGARATDDADATGASTAAGDAGRGDDTRSGDETGGGDAGSDEQPAVVERDVVGSAFADAAPRTLPEVVDESGLEREATERALAALVEEGSLAAKTLETGAATLRVWYLPASEHVERLAPGAPDADRAEAVAETIETLDVPGVSEMMQDWRRDAVRGAWEYLVEHGAATDAAVVDAVYPGHSAGYDDRDAWWDCVRPRLASLPGVAPPGDGANDVWTYAPA